MVYFFFLFGWYNIVHCISYNNDGCCTQIDGWHPLSFDQYMCMLLHSNICWPLTKRYFYLANFSWAFLLFSFLFCMLPVLSFIIFQYTVKHNKNIILQHIEGKFMFTGFDLIEFSIPHLCCSGSLLCDFCMFFFCDVFGDSLSFGLNRIKQTIKKVYTHIMFWFLVVFYFFWCIHLMGSILWMRGEVDKNKKLISSSRECDRRHHLPHPQWF